MGFAGDHAGARIGLGRRNRRINCHRVMPVDGLHMPAGCREPGGLVGDVGQIDFAVDGDVIVVKKHDQVAKMLHPGQTDGFLTDPLHQAPISGDDIGMVVLHSGPITGAQDFFGNRKADRIG